MGVTPSIPRIVMLGMIDEYYLSQYAFFQPQKLVALDEVVFKLWRIDGKVHPNKWLACGIVCFEEGRPMKQVFTALRAADRTYNLPEYEVWCHPNTLNEARTVVRRLPHNISSKTTIHSITKIWNPQKRSNLLVYAPHSE